MADKYGGIEYMANTEKDFHMFVVPNEYKFVLLVVVLQAFQLMITGFVSSGRTRRDDFGEEWMEKEFGDEHEKAIGTKIGKGGYPDCGSGLYTMRAGYKTWFEFNIGQRIHHNYLEGAH